MPDPIIRIVSAEEAYDGFGTETIEWLDYQDRGGRRYRKISIPEDAQFAGWQVLRYSSGLYPTLTEEQFAQWIADGSVSPVEPNLSEE